MKTDELTKNKIIRFTKLMTSEQIHKEKSNIKNALWITGVDHFSYV